jgi:hypothetical protein
MRKRKGCLRVRGKKVDAGYSILDASEAYPGSCQFPVDGEGK